MSKPGSLFLAALPLALLPVAVFAAEGEQTTTEGDVIVVEEYTPPAASAPSQPDRPVPTRGMDMDNVRNVFGEPQEEHAPVGDPPITRWDYDGYSVFFEYDKVLHSVIND